MGWISLCVWMSMYINEGLVNKVNRKDIILFLIKQDAPCVSALMLLVNDKHSFNLWPPLSGKRYVLSVQPRQFCLALISWVEVQDCLLRSSLLFTFRVLIFKHIISSVIWLLQQRESKRKLKEENNKQIMIVKQKL